jgi:aspartate racemase
MILGVIGGMGPLATCNFFEKIIRLTDADKDQEHIHIIIDNNTSIPDRTDYILGHGKDPRPELIKSAIKLESMGADYIAIPCNTAHYFYEDIVKYIDVKIINMIEETAMYISKACSEHRDYLLLSTEGTYKSEIYKKVFEKHGLRIIEPSDEDKKTIMGWIYGVKSSVFNVTSQEFEAFVNKYIENKSIPVILGCTELSTLAEKIDLRLKYVDPLLILAKRCVELHQIASCNE